MKTIKLHLKISTNGNVMAWEVFLGDPESTTPINFNGSNEKTFDTFNCQDDVLRVYVGSEGSIGGETSCTVTINDVTQEQKVISKNIDHDYTYVNFPV